MKIRSRSGAATRGPGPDLVKEKNGADLEQKVNRSSGPNVEQEVEHHLEHESGAATGSLGPDLGQEELHVGQQSEADLEQQLCTKQGQNWSFKAY